MFERAKFEVTVYIDKVTNIPYSAGKLFVRWNVTDSPRPESKGRTNGVELHRNTAVFDRTATFAQRIGTRTPSTTLRSCEIVFEVIWEPLGSRGMSIGEVSLDIAQFAPDPILLKEDKPLESLPESKAILLEHARANCLLNVGIGLKYIKGPTNYRVPEFDAPVVRADYEKVCQIKEIDPFSSAKCNHQLLAKLRDEILSEVVEAGCSLNLMESVSDLLKGGDGFGGIKPDAPAPDRANRGPHQPGTPFYESVLRDNYISWNMKLT